MELNVKVNEKAGDRTLGEIGKAVREGSKHFRKYISAPIKLTPELARSWLETRCRNRKISEENVQKYAAEMAAGRWKLHHQGIAFDDEGFVSDGEHRLWACYVSGATIDIMVFVGLDEDGRSAVDCGLSRPGHVRFDLKHDTKVSSKKLFESGGILRALVDGANSVRVTPDQMETLTKRYKKDLEWILNAVVPKRGTASRLLPSAVRGALALAHAAYAAESELFLERYISGADLGADSPVFVLRNVVDRSSARTDIERRELAFKVLRAVKGFILNEKLTRLYAHDDIVAYFQRPAATEPKIRKVS